jgi:RNase adapter protein RapZ
VAHKLMLMSFSIPKGMPITTRRSSFFDVRRRIRNPYHVEALRDKTGLDPEVQQFVEACKGYDEMKERAILLAKARSVLAFGCHGGIHRSVAAVELLGRALREAFPDIDITVEHRDLPKGE